MHIIYKNKLGHEADFKVRYRFYTDTEGGRKSMPYQGYRSDFWYSHFMHDGTNQLFMIWPEFLDENGEVILDNKIPISSSGIAQMWIINPEMRNYHIDKIVLSLKGYFMEGPTRVAECEVIELGNLTLNHDGRNE